MRTALITGINGQDGSYLAELLLNKGYHVVGTVREYPNSASDLIHAGRTSKSIQIVEADLREQAVLEDLLRTYQPEELYNLAARASSSELWTDPMSTGELNGLAVLRLLDAVDRVAPRTNSSRLPAARFSEMRLKRHRVKRRGFIREIHMAQPKRLPIG